MNAKGWKDLGGLPVVQRPDDRRIVGIVEQRDLLRALHLSQESRESGLALGRSLSSPSGLCNRGGVHRQRGQGAAAASRRHGSPDRAAARSRRPAADGQS